MNTRTWPFGTTRRVTVVAVEGTRYQQVVACASEERPDGREGFLLVNPAGTYDVKPDDTGTITFTRGGPAGGHWRLEVDPRPGPEPRKEDP